MFFENILPSVLAYLSDPVYAIREMGCCVLKKLHEIYKGEELEKRIIEKFNEMRASHSYLIRNTILIFLKVII
jgi:hypothetical protein